LDELQAALLLDRLNIVDEHNAQRQEIARQYDCELGYLNPVPSRVGRVPHLYVVRPPDRLEFRKFLLRTGIQTGVHYALALPKHRYLQLHGIDTGCPFARQACETVVSLPCYPGMSRKHIMNVIDACHCWKDQSQT
jgi:dTDP-4-amino-4,6-dideoxygalactose transaminase